MTEVAQARPSRPGLPVDVVRLATSAMDTLVAQAVEHTMDSCHSRYFATYTCAFIVLHTLLNVVFLTPENTLCYRHQML